MDSLDFLAEPPRGAQTSPAAERNAGPILDVLKAHFPAHGALLEIAAGTGRHAVGFAAALPGLDWTPSDPDADARASISAWCEAAHLPNLKAPIAVDCMNPDSWPDTAFDAILCANMIHISPWAATEGLTALAGQALRKPGGLLALYGPYREADVALAPSNAAFDDSLKTRNPDWGLRDRAAVESLARSHGLAATLRVEMPANNLMLLFRRV